MNRPGAGSTPQMILLTVAVTAAAYAGTTVSPLQETMRAALHLTDDDMAILQGPALALPMVALALPLGFIVDRWVRVRLIVAFAACDLLGTLLTALAPGFAVLVIARGVIGLMTTAVNPVALSLIADLFEAERRGRATMIMALGQTVGAAAAFGAGGALLGMMDSKAHGWRFVMLLLAVPLVPVLIASFALKEPRRSGVVIVRPSLRETLGELRLYRARVAPLMGGTVLAQIALGAVLVWTAPALSRVYALPPERIGLVMAMVMLVSGIAGPAAGGFLADACQRSGGPRRTLLALGLSTLIAVPMALFAAAPSVWVSSVLVALFTSVISASSVMGTTLLTIVVPNELRGLILGIFAALSVLFSVGVAPMLVSRLSGIVGGPSMIGEALGAVCGGATLLACAIFGAALRGFPVQSGRA